ncbi:eukaryotic translation initiation factor eIF-2-beta/eIF-5 family protein [Haloquadratum walsbyi]|nr:hypothetical protein [Haloquadratum walsbyi]
MTDAVESYTETYVFCHECGSLDTHLIDRQDATVLKCDACGAISPVSNP